MKYIIGALETHIYKYLKAIKYSGPNFLPTLLLVMEFKKIKSSETLLILVCPSGRSVIKDIFKYVYC